MSKRKEITKDQLSTEFMDNLKDWILLTQKIENYNKQIKEMKKLKDNIEYKLIPYMIKNNLENKALQYQNKKIVIQNDKTYTNLSYKYLYNELDNFFKEKTSSDKTELINEMINYLKSKRNIKTNKVMNML